MNTLKIKHKNINLQFAKFLGWNINKPFGVEVVTIPSNLYFPTQIREIESGMFDFTMEDSELLFHNDWNWLMTVVFKIAEIRETDIITTLQHLFGTSMQFNDISQLYEQCSIFVNHYLNTIK